MSTAAKQIVTNQITENQIAANQITTHRTKLRVKLVSFKFFTITSELYVPRRWNINTACEYDCKNDFLISKEHSLALEYVILTRAIYTSC